MKSIRKTTEVLLAGGLTFFRRASARGLQVKAPAGVPAPDGGAGSSRA